MQGFDWRQQASLGRINGYEFSDGRKHPIIIPILSGELVDLLNVFAERRDREACQLTIAGGFHLNGAEIEDLIALRD